MIQSTELFLLTNRSAFNCLKCQHNGLLEQVDANGFSWRSGAKVEKLNLKQWFLKITAFKEALLNDLDWLRLWPERVISMQRNWLGRSKGANVKFDIADDSGNDAGLQSINIFTTRPDTLYGVQYLCLSANHPVVTRLCDEDPALHAFVNSLGSLPVNSKHGYQLQGIHAKSPLRHLGDVPESVLEPLPIFVSPYVVESYGEGAIMGVPAHDARDWEFWEHNSGSTLPRQVVFPRIETPEADSRQTVKVFTDPGVLSISCGRYAGLDSRDAAQLIVSDLSKIGGHAEFSQTWRLRDWLISRQRYWGTPIPIVHCPGCGAVPVPLDQLPVKLPKIESSSFKHRTGNPLGDAHEWVNTTCPKCSGPAKRDTDTMDTFMDSSWYMFRFTDPQNEREPFAPALANANMPVDVYLGGVEHAILHLLYARFIGKFLATTSLWPAGRAPNIRGEPFKQQISQGMVHGKTYSDPETGKFLRQDELDLSNLLQPKILASGKPPNVSFEKMSKSKHNGVDPSSVIAKYGADVTRAHMLFQAPVSEVLEWEEERIAGIQRWLHRLRNITQIISANLAQREPFEPSTTQPFPFPIPNLATLPTEEASLYLTTLRTVASIITSLSTTYALNTCISDLMSLTNALVRWQDNLQKLSASTLYHVPSALIRLLAPFVPAFAEECWEILHSNTRIPYPYLEGATNPNPQPKSHYSIKKSPRLSAPERAKPTPEASPEPTYPAASVFNHPFPPASATDIKTLEARTSTSEQTCAVMENGKLRFTVPIELAPEGMEGEELQEWVVAQIDKTIEGRLGLWRMREAREGRQWRRMVVVKGGRTVNFVE